MTPVFHQTIAIKSLLGKFIDIIYLSDNELELIQDDILSVKPVSDIFSDDSEVYETVVYLRDLAQESNFKTIEELVDYFDGQQAGLKTLVRPFLAMTNNEFLAINNERSFTSQFKPDSVRLLPQSSYSDFTDTYNDFVNRLFRSLQHMNPNVCVERKYKELNPTAHWLKMFKFFRANSFGRSIILNSDPYYYKYFVSNASSLFKLFSHLILYIKRVMSLPWLLLNDTKAFLSVVAKRKKQQRKIKSVYEKVFEFIHTGKIMETEEFKNMMSRIMINSKLNSSSFRKYVKVKQDKVERQSASSGVPESDFMVMKLFYRALSEKKWSILESPVGHSWITTDNPGFSIDIAPFCTKGSAVRPDPYWSDIESASMIYFPLSKQYCLRLQPTDVNKMVANRSADNCVSFEISTEEELKVVNSLVRSNPEVILSGNHGNQVLCGHDEF
jgi:hypothetical protein